PASAWYALGSARSMNRSLSRGARSFIGPPCSTSRAMTGSRAATSATGGEAHPWHGGEPTGSVRGVQERLVFGDGWVEAELPDDARFVEPGISLPLPPAQDLEDTVRDALDHPLDTPPLRELSRGAGRVP